MASMRYPYGVVADDVVNVFVADTLDHRLRKFSRYSGFGLPLVA
jgi:hypothetical protein